MLTKFCCQIRILLENKFFKACLKSLFSGKSYKNLNHLIFHKACLEIYTMHKTCPPHMKYSFWLTSSVSPLQSSDLPMALFLWSVTSSDGTGQITCRHEHRCLSGAFSSCNKYWCRELMLKGMWDNQMWFSCFVLPHYSRSFQSQGSFSFQRHQTAYAVVKITKKPS